MNICILCKWDYYGGAARAAYRLFRALQQQDEHVEYLVHDKAINDQNIHSVTVFEHQPGLKDEGVIQKNYIADNRTNISNTFFSVTYNGVDLRSNKFLHEADIINLHWVEKFLSLNTLNYLAALGKPIVWTLHDERPFTGGCHYTAGCTEYIDSNCLSCRQLIFDPCKLPNAVHAGMKKLVQKANITVVSPSIWLARKAEESSIFSGKRIEVIPNSVETDVFYPRDRRDVRDKHGIPQDAFVILSGSDNGSDLRKGYKEYIESIMFCLNDETFKLKADRKEIAIVTFGTTSRCEIDKHITHLSVGHIDDDETLAEIYAAADIYVTATLEDNLPNTVLESMACGTTVVGFETGGIPDMVKNKYNGALVPVKDTKALAEAILFLFSNPEKTDEYGRNSRKTIEGNFTQTHQAERYLELFKDLKPIEQEMEPVDADEIFSCALQVSQLTRQMTNKINKELWEKQNIINKLNEDIVEKQNIIDLKNAEINSIIHSKKYRLAQFIAAPVIKLKRKP